MSNRTIKLIPYSKEKFPQTKTINGVPVEEATKKYQTVKVITDEQGKPVRTGEDYFIDEQENPLKPKELQEITISAPAHLSDEEYRQYLLNSQDFNRRQGLPINYDNIPLFTYDNGITGKRNVNRNTYERYIAADNKSRAFNKQMDAIVAGATGIMASPYLLGAAAPWITTTFAPGTVGGNILGDTAGMIAIDETSKALTGRTTGQHIGDALGLAEDSNWRYAVDFANPINIAGPKLLNRGVSSGVRYAGKLSTGARNLIAPYQKAFNYFSKNFNNMGPSLGINTSRAFSLLKSPSKVKVFMEFPDFYEAIPSYDWGKYSARQFKNFANIYKQEAEKQKFYSGEFGPLKSINPGSTEMQIKNAFEQARNIQHYVDFAERYGKYRGNLYNKYYAELSKDAVWKSILDESPQYMDDIVQFVKNGRTDKEQFVKDLIKKSNSYRRQMPQNFNEDQWLTLNGKSNSRRNVGSIDVEGANRSGDYGKYSGWFEGQPTITGPIETWWSQRIPQGVSRYRGMHSIDNIPPKFYNMLNKEDAELQGISAFFNGYDSTGAPGAYISQPWHQVFVGPIGSRLPNFKVTLSDEMPKGFSYGKGYKTGGKLISKLNKNKISN